MQVSMHLTFVRSHLLGLTASFVDYHRAVVAAVYKTSLIDHCLVYCIRKPVAKFLVRNLLAVNVICMNIYIYNMS